MDEPMLKLECAWKSEILAASAHLSSTHTNAGTTQRLAQPLRKHGMPIHEAKKKILAADEFSPTHTQVQKGCLNLPFDTSASPN